MSARPLPDDCRTALKVVSWVRHQNSNEPLEFAFWDDVLRRLEHELIGSGVPKDGSDNDLA